MRGPRRLGLLRASVHEEPLPKSGGGECFSRVKVPESLGPLALEFSFVFPDAGEKWVWGERGVGSASLGGRAVGAPAYSAFPRG